jgi:hypothetical protein
MGFKAMKYSELSPPSNFYFSLYHFLLCCFYFLVRKQQMHKHDIPEVTMKYISSTGGKGEDERRGEKDTVKRKTVWYLLNHHIPIHSPEGPVITLLIITPLIIAALASAAAPRFLLAILASLQGKQ